MEIFLPHLFRCCNFINSCRLHQQELLVEIIGRGQPNELKDCILHPVDLLVECFYQFVVNDVEVGVPHPRVDQLLV